MSKLTLAYFLFRNVISVSDDTDDEHTRRTTLANVAFSGDVG